ncbi:hypothetical protein RND81_13G047100 [Saponaria officinalis]|uniref:Bifunctional inhibitor/plant lipid transfer protein/seed storage helical domain-containing protein n=1 Tax=Saponaria officinalis TaxID=3572 RepID=A0AAW1GU45_SAPOF
MKMTMMMMVGLVAMVLISLSISPSMAQTDCTLTANNIISDCDPAASTVDALAECCSSIELAATTDTTCFCLIIDAAIAQDPNFPADEVITTCGIPDSLATLCPGH